MEEQRRTEWYLETSKKSQSVKLVTLPSLPHPPNPPSYLPPPPPPPPPPQVMKVLDDILITSHSEVILQECPKLITENNVKSMLINTS